MSNRVARSIGTALGRLPAKRQYAALSLSLMDTLAPNNLARNDSEEPKAGPSNYLHLGAKGDPAAGNKNVAQPALSTTSAVSLSRDPPPSTYTGLNRNTIRSRRRKHRRASSRNALRDTSTLSYEEQDAIHRLEDLISRPWQQRQDSPSFHNQVWTLYKNLPTHARETLPLVVHQRVLRMVVPERDATLSIHNDRLKIYDPSQWALSRLTEYPWESRLRYVISAIRERHERRKAEGKETVAFNGIRPANETVDFNDYLFVLRQFSYTGYVAGVEKVVAEAMSCGFPSNTGILDLRLSTMAKWLSVRNRHHSREAAFQARIGPSSIDFNPKAAAWTNDQKATASTSALLGLILQEMQANDNVQFRRVTFDHLLRVAQESGSAPTFEAVLRAGYDIDLKYPGITLNKPMQPAARTSNRSSRKSLFTSNRQLTERSSSKRCPLSVHAMNTILRFLEGNGDIWKMVSVMEAFGLRDSRAADAGLGVAGMSRAVTGVERELSGVSVEDSAKAKLDFAQDGTAPTDQLDGAERLEEEEPITLSAALAKEESSGDRIYIFGRPAHLQSPAIADAPTSRIMFRPRSWSEFLTAPPPAVVLRDLVSAHPFAKELIGDHSESLRGTPLNTTSYSILIQAASTAVRDAVANHEVNAAHNAMLLAVHATRTLLRETKLRRNEFLKDWIALQHEARARVAAVQNDKTASETERRENLHRIRAWLDAVQSRSVHPLITLNAESLKPLFTAIRDYAASGFSSRGTATPQLYRSILRDIKADIQEQKDEYEILFGYQWGSDNRVLRPQHHEVVNSPLGTSTSRATLGRPAEQSHEIGSLNDMDGNNESDESSWTDNAEEEWTWTSPLRFSLPSHIALLRRRIHGLEALVKKKSKTRK